MVEMETHRLQYVFSLVFIASFAGLGLAAACFGSFTGRHIVSVGGRVWCDSAVSRTREWFLSSKGNWKEDVVKYLCCSALGAGEASSKWCRDEVEIVSQVCAWTKFLEG
jgi:hypothetical protein